MTTAYQLSVSFSRKLQLAEANQQFASEKRGLFQFLYKFHNFSYLDVQQTQHFNFAKRDT